MSGIADLSRIPPFPPVAGRLLHLLADEDVNVELVADTIRGDPSLSADVLRLANSPLFAHSGTIDSIPHAITMLGSSRLRRMAVTAATNSYLKESQKREEFRRCWKHTLATAFLTEELSWACQLAEDRGYIAGLLHDLGRMGLLVAFPQEYANLLMVASENALDVLELERHRFGLDHCAAGRELAQSWNLPQDLVVIAGRHHDSLEGKEIDLLYLGHLGCRLADALGYDVVKSGRPSTVGEIIANLPEAARQRFCPDIKELKDALDAEITAFDDGTAVDVSILSRHADAHEPEEAPVATASAAPGGKVYLSNTMVMVLSAIIAALLTLAALTR